ncbi:MAG: aldo/keto reductase [Treponema sp.]|nr:aldo/keto reductase [Treponema sp.]
MEKRNFGNGEVSLLGFGLMRLPCKNGNADIDREQAGKMLDAALAGGVNYFDTAWMYHGGQSEPFAGEALSRYERSSFYLASKMPVMVLQNAGDVERIFTEQLKKCRTDYFDFYLVHGIRHNYLKVIEDCRVYEQLQKKKEAGCIRHLGFSFHDRPELLQRIVDEHAYDFAQIQLNYLDWELQDAKGQYQILAQKHIPVHIMEPVRGGSLANLGAEAAGIFKEARPAASPASWALRYAASLSGVQVVLSGMTTLEQLTDNIATFSPFAPLTDTERGVIANALGAYRKTLAVPCTSCRYCMDCPSGVEIPKALAVYNNRARLAAEKHPMADFLFTMEYGMLKEEEQAKQCMDCGQCKERCPQHLDIPHWMKQVAELHETLQAK